MTVLWRRVDLAGLEWCEITERDTGNQLVGVVLLDYQGTICRLDYLVACDTKWRTRSATIEGHVGRREAALDLRRDQGTWLLNETRLEGVDECIDIDLGFSPSTNLLPLRRLKLRRGRPTNVTACWVEFPSLAIKPLRQTYTRTDRKTVHYETAEGRFQRDLEVSAAGVVLRYPGLWEAQGIVR